MADISRVKTIRHDVAEYTPVALATTGKTIDFEGVDENCVILITGSANDTVTFVKGDHIQGVADLEVSITANKTYAIAVPSMEFKNVSGTNKGLVVVKGASTTTVAVVEIDQL
jgi:hypothetical protein